MRLTVCETELLKSQITQKVNDLVHQFEDEREDFKNNLPWYHSWLEFFLPSMAEKEPDMYEDDRFLLAKKLMYMHDRSFKYQYTVLDYHNHIDGFYEVSDSDYEFIQQNLGD